MPEFQFWGWPSFQDIPRYLDHQNVMLSVSSGGSGVIDQCSSCVGGYPHPYSVQASFSKPSSAESRVWSLGDFWYAKQLILWNLILWAVSAMFWGLSLLSIDLISIFVLMYQGPCRRQLDGEGDSTRSPPQTTETAFPEREIPRFLWLCTSIGLAGPGPWPKWH